MTDPVQSQKPEFDTPDDTGLPLLRTWPAVYAFVLGFFVLLVILLALFTRAYS